MRKIGGTYQDIGGSSPASIGEYVYNPWLLKMAKVAKELICTDDYLPDALSMRLLSSNTIVQLINCDFLDTGNCAVTIVIIAFLRIFSYTVNGKNAHWKVRAIFSWTTFI